MKFIEIKDATPPVGGEWIVSNYPGPGCYYVQSVNSYIFVGGGSYMSVDSQFVTASEKMPPPAATPALSGVSESALLKAIAISRDPALATQLAL